MTDTADHIQERDYGFDTLALHAGQEVDPATTARAVPIYQSTSYVFDDTDRAANLFALAEEGNIYTRIMNPTTDVFEKRVAALEKGVGALATASGQSATALSILNIMGAGDELVSAAELYGGTYNLFHYTLPKVGIDVKFADSTNLDALRDAITDRTRAVFAETVGNPALNALDIEGAAAVAHDAGVPLIVDNTLATPYLIRPIEHGADIVVHSLTKFLGGHGNSIGGLIVDGGTFNWSREKRYPMLTEPRPEYHGIVFHETFGNFAFAVACRFLALRDMGPALSPFNAFLILTGIETLPLRMQLHCDNTLAVAQWLNTHGKVAWVSYPGLPGDRYHNLAKKYVPKGAGSVFTFGLKGGYDAGVKLVSNVKLFSHLANIGDTRSLIIHPASTTHRQLTDAQKVQAGAGPDVVRLSIGLEDKDDIIADLEQALAA
jgi:O-acetylhomoserine (thiol)-lyase